LWLPVELGRIVSMIEMVLAHSDLARVRFAHSPIAELVTSLRVLQDPGRQLMYGRWLSTMRPQLDGLRLDLLAALAPTGRYLPAFLFPPSTRPWGVLAEELAQVAASPPAMVRAELDKVREGAPLPAVLGPLYDDPAGQLPAVVEEMARYWEAAIEPVWPRLRGLCAADLAYLMEQFAGGGLARVLGDLHPDLGFADELLRVDKPHHCSHRFDLAGSGIVLVPCAFTWPSLSVDCCGVDQPALIYPPRGVAELWEDTMAEQPDPLSALVGRTRATLLAALALPSSTTQLAAQLELSPAAVSQHLKILKDAALVSGQRRGRMVLYQRTPTAAALLETVRSHEETG
jgi:DNA-binding transcriptional ArsR family regulator